MTSVPYSFYTDEDDVVDYEIPEEVTAPHKPVDEISHRFQRDIEDAEDLERRLQNSEPDAKKKARQCFVNDRLHWWRQKTHDNMNFLHFLAYYYLKPKPSLHMIMATAITKMTAEMGIMDNNRYTPLALALMRDNYQFIHAICKNLADNTRKSIGEALRSECDEQEAERGTTCLHQAISWGRRNELIKIIIGFVPEAMFISRDAKGRTPLHLAVEYDRCSIAHADLVEELLRRGPAAMDEKISDGSDSSTVYQYHERTRKAAEDKMRKKASAMQSRESAQQENKESKESGSKKGIPETMKAAKPDSAKDKTEPHGTKYSAKRRESFSYSPAPTPTGTDSGKPSNLGLVNTRFAQAKRPEGDIIETQQSMSKPQSDVWKTENDEERMRSSDKIRRLLKLFYLRSKRPQEAVAHLHVQGQRDTELWFDFGQERVAKLTPREFQKQFGHLEFDKALHYVAIPQLESNISIDSEDERYQGRVDLVFVFDWLKKKGIEHIIRVEVDDMEYPGHSDEAIEKALRQFKVEVLDWRRRDLCPLMISAIGENLREIYLQWSGRNTVLRSWSEHEGLCLTPSLEKIVIKQAEGLESETRTKSNLEQFAERLLNSWPEGRPRPELVLPRSGGGRLRRRITTSSDGSATFQKKERYVDPHQWMQCMEEFASYFRQVKGIRDAMGDESLNPVTVALIDDGADITHPELKGNKFPGKSFDFYREGWRVSPFWSSASGHGTLMTRLIHRICPSAMIYIIKLRTVKTVKSAKLQIDTRSAIEASAIEYAIENGAQIISMSWATKRPDNEADRDAFDKAIRKAHSKNILMFCSAIDQGKFKDPTYPHASNPNYTFKVGAAKATGVTPGYVNDRELNFIFPGHEVVLSSTYEDVTDKLLENFTAHKGSSVATALASGLAALVLECVRLSHISTLKDPRQKGRGAIQRADMDRIRKREALESAFSYISGGLQVDNKYIEVWKTFTEFGEDLKRNEGASEAQLDVITGFARLFLRKTD